jgi:hypothetical protein
MKSPLEEFIGMSSDGVFEVRRLKDQAKLTPEIIAQMQKQASAQLGKHYDYGFSWNDSELYCSEYVWKLYNDALQISIGEPKRLKEFDLSHPVVKSTLHQRYGKKIPLEEKMISPGDMFESELVE